MNKFERHKKLLKTTKTHKSQKIANSNTTENHQKTQKPLKINKNCLIKTMYMKHDPCSPIMKNCKLEGKVSQGASLYTTTT